MMWNQVGDRDHGRPHTAKQTTLSGNNMITLRTVPIQRPVTIPVSAFEDTSRCQCLDGRDVVKRILSQWLSNQATDFYKDGIQKSIIRYDMCLNSNGNFVDKQIKVRTFMQK